MTIDKRSLAIGMLLNNTAQKLDSINFAQPAIIKFSVNWALTTIQKFDPITPDEELEIDKYLTEGANKSLLFFEEENKLKTKDNGKRVYG